MALTGRLSNTSYMGFQYSVENVVDHLTTTSITAIPDERRSIEELKGMSWHLKPPEQTSVRVPSRVAVNERLNRSISLRFERYRQTPQPPRYLVDQHDREQESLEREPLNKVQAIQQTKTIKGKSMGQKVNTWGTTGKWDLLYDDEVTPGKVTILEERSDWDDDERSGGKVLVIQERLAQNQQEFLDEYLPQWDENLAIQKKESESEWENPFAAKRGENHTILHLSKEEENDDLPYPKFRNFKQVAAQIIKKHEEHAFPSSSSQIESTQSYQPPHDSIMGPPVYPPAQQNPQPFYRPDYQFGYPQGKGKTFSGGYGEYYNSQWTLPPAWTESGVMLVLPADPGLCLLGESKKLMWQQWRTAYPGAYSALEAIADEPQNITSQVRQLILLEDPYRGSTDEQDRAYRDLDRITCEETKNLWSFLEDFRQLATKSGRLYFPSTTEKLFAKLPPSLSKKIEESFRNKHPGLSSGVLPAIKFTHTFVSEMCKDAALAKELRDLSLCSAIPILGYYKNNRKKYGMRKSRTYKGKPHNSHVKPFKRKYKDDRGRVKKCKCFICGKEGHFAKDCRSKQGNIARSAVYQELDLDDNWDIVSADFDDNSVYSISEGEGDTHQSISVMVQDTPVEETVFMAIEDDESDDELEEEDNQFSHHAFMFHPGPPTKIAEMVQSVGSWKPNKELPAKKLKNERLKEQKDEEIRELKAQLQKKEEEAEVQFSKEEFPPLGNTHVVRPCVETEVHYSRNATTSPKIRKITNQLYNVKVEFDIPNCTAFGTTAIIDTGASACCINKKVIPKEALEPLTQIVVFNGLNSRQQATHRIKQGYFLIKESKFKIPLIYAFDMRDNNGIEMLIGANFLRSMKRGIRIEGDEITIYKKVTKIKISNQTEIAEIAELEVSEEEFLEINESIYFNQEGSRAFQEQFKPVIDRLKQQGYIGEEVQKEFIYYLDKQEVTLRTDCQAIISFYNKTNSNKSSRVRWIKFADAVTGTGVKINIEHIQGKHNTLADSLSRLVNLCFAECTGEMKELAATTLNSVDEVLQSPNAFQKNMKTTCEEVMKISNHFLESSQKLSSHLKNQEHYTKVAQDLELSAAKEVIKAMRNLQAIIQCKAQICFGKSTKDNHWSDQREDVRVQNKEARRILIDLEALAQRLRRNNI
ncbi:Orf y [Tanacetum coccineum]